MISDWIFAYIGLGVFTGFLSGLFGIGGGLILVPVLLFLFEAQQLHDSHLMHLALGTSMAIILFTSISSISKHHQHSAVNWSFVRRVTPGIWLGTALGAISAGMLPTSGLTICFAIFTLLTALQILFDIKPHARKKLPGIKGITAFGTIAGWVSSLVAIGGGVLVVPYLIWHSFNLRQAIATSAAVGFPIALGATLGYIVTGWHMLDNLPYHLGFVYLPALLYVAPAGMLLAPLGAKIAHRIDIAPLRKLLALLLFALVIKMVLRLID